MPRVVDHDERRQQIARAAIELIARDGTPGLTMRALARELGGSLTLVTHYYASRSDLMRDLAAQLTAAWRDELAELEIGVSDPVERLRVLLDWLLPLTDEGRQEEWSRFAMLMERSDPECRAVLIDFDRGMRDILRQHLRGIVPKDRLTSAVNLLRAVTNGVVLDAMVAPESWTATRQRAVVEHALRLVLDDATRQS
jgi:AcrR family transcriptional regulator